MSSSVIGFNGIYQIHGGKMTKTKRSARAHRMKISRLNVLILEDFRHAGNRVPNNMLKDMRIRPQKG